MKLFALLCAAALLAAPAAAAQVKPAPDAEAADEAGTLELLRAAVSDMRERMFAPGPAEENWDEGGGDPDAALRAAGAETHYLLHSGDSTSVVMLTGRPIAAFAPAEWRIADSYGTAEVPVANPFVQFTRLTARYVVASRSNSRRVGTVDCGDPVAHAILYELPDTPEAPEDADVPMLFRIFLLAAEDQVVCTRYEADGTAWRPRSFLPNGRSLPQLDEQTDRVRIVPAAPLGTLLLPPGPRATT